MWSNDRCDYYPLNEWKKNSEYWQACFLTNTCSMLLIVVKYLQSEEKGVDEPAPTYHHHNLLPAWK